MVKFRGIEVSIISQFDIRKLPEFSPRTSPDPFNTVGPSLRSKDSMTASCYVPIYPGSQVWFEYTIDGPHPPGAAYFFKLLLNGNIITSWDCTAKHGYHGKTTYNLHCEDKDDLTDQTIVKRQAFKFSSLETRPPGMFDDCVELRVYRVEHRKRIRTEDVFRPATADRIGQNHTGLW